MRPLPEITKISGGKYPLNYWLKLYEEGKLRAGAVLEEPFCMFIDSNAKMTVADFHRVLEPTVCFFIEEATCWKLAGRSYSVYSAYMMGKPIRAQGDFQIRDMELVDEILQMFYGALKADGFDLAALFMQETRGV